MTANRDLKRRVRERQARTGESYTTALHHVRAQRPIPISTVELLDVTQAASEVGLRCRVSMGPQLAGRADVHPTLRHFHDVLVASARDRALFLMRTVALFGEHVTAPAMPRGLTEGVAFMQRLRAGLGGVSEHGRMLALPWIAKPAGTSPALVERAARHVDRAHGHGPAVERPALSVDTRARTPAVDEPAPPYLGAHLALYGVALSPAFVAAGRPPTLIVTAHDDLIAGDPITDFAINHLPDPEAP